MQCLCAPSRADIDKAHSRNDWVDVGVQSVRNLGRIPTTRRLLWWTLAMSSIPLHLLWNSAVFTTLGANLYQPYLVPNNFVELVTADPTLNVSATVTKYVKDPSTFDRLDKDACLTTYGQSFISMYQDVLLVAVEDGNATAITDPVETTYVPTSPINPLTWEDGISPYNWLCESFSEGQFETCVISNLTGRLRNGQKWTYSSVDGYPSDGTATVDHCLAERVPEHCATQFSVPILTVVIVFNAIKLVCLLVTALTQDSTLVTLGDAIASFLDRQDPATKGLCLRGRKEFDAKDRMGKKVSWNYQALTIPERRVQQYKFRQSASGTRWAVTLFLYVESSKRINNSQAIRKLTICADVSSPS